MHLCTLLFALFCLRLPFRSPRLVFYSPYTSAAMARSVKSFGALFLTLAIFILSAAAERRARLVPQRRTDYNGGWALAVPGSTCPADASVACSTNGGYVNPTCCPSGQTCFGYASPYCCPSSKSSLSQHSNKRSLPSLPLEKLATDESCLLPK
jgi:hypothetical protein